MFKKTNFEIVVSPRNAPSYRTSQEFYVVEEGKIEEASSELFYRQFEMFSDEELLDGNSAQFFITDGIRTECHFVSTDGRADDKVQLREGMLEHFTDAECLLSLSIDRAAKSSFECLTGQWFLVDSDVALSV